MEVTPQQLENQGGPPKPLGLHCASASQIAKDLGLKRVGEDREVNRIGPLSSARADREESYLTYFGDSRYEAELTGITGCLIVSEARFVDQVPDGNTILVADNARSTFYSLLEAMVDNGVFQRLCGYRSPTARVAQSAVISENVYIDDEAVIDPGVMLYPNSYIGKGVRVKANAVIGGDGFEPVHFGNRRRIAKHAGGVWLAGQSWVGSSTCIDKGLFGEFTYLGEQSFVDNLVHIAHSVRIGEECSVVAAAEVSGTVVLEDGVWVGPCVSINQQLRLGKGSFIGTGSVVVKDVPRHALSFGAPAKSSSFVCRCRTKLIFHNDRATCPNCEREFAIRDGLCEELPQ